MYLQRDWKYEARGGLRLLRDGSLFWDFPKDGRIFGSKCGHDKFYIY